MAGVWVAGEALIDLISHGGTTRAVVGGGPANTAKALAQLGIETFFIGGISQDSYGAQIESELAQSGVDLSLSLRSKLPTAIAVVQLNEAGSPEYEFKLENSATFDFRVEWLPKGSPEVIYLGTLATIIQPGAKALFEWARSQRVPIIFDPNVRPSVLVNRESYRASVERFASISKVVKVSSEDLNWLGYKSISNFFELGAKLVVVTDGEHGLSGFTASGKVTVPGVKVDVVDTVGAGDTVGAVLVEGLLKYGLEEMRDENLFAMLSRAAKAASVTCSRAGATPPTLSELG